jgi:hypothetical protein
LILSVRQPKGLGDQSLIQGSGCDVTNADNRNIAWHTQTSLPNGIDGAQEVLSAVEHKRAGATGDSVRAACGGDLSGSQGSREQVGLIVQFPCRSEDAILLFAAGLIWIAARYSGPERPFPPSAQHIRRQPSG